MSLEELNEFTLVKMSLHELKDDKSEEKWKNWEKSSKRCDDRKVGKNTDIFLEAREVDSRA